MLFTAGLIAVETLILTVSFSLSAGRAVARSDRRVLPVGSRGTRSKATVIVVGALASVSIPLISLMLVVGRLGGANL